MAVLAAVFIASIAIGYTGWKAWDVGIFVRADSPANPGIYERAYDVRHFDDLPRSPGPESRLAADEKFAAILAAAVGWKAPKLDRVTWTGEIIPGATVGVRIVHRFPPVESPALFRASKENPRGLLIVIPGFGMNAASVFGHRDGPLSGVGLRANDWGFDVLAMEPIHAPFMAAAINTRLTMMGAQLHGLQARQACDAIRAAVKRRGYRSVVVYGFGSGGFIAEILSVLCGVPKMRVIVDGFPLPLKDTLWRAVRSHLVDHPLIFQFRRPLLRFLDAGALATASRVGKTYLLDENSMAAVRARLSGRLEALKNYGLAKDRIVFIIKVKAKRARINSELIRRVLIHDGSTIDGWILR